MDSKIPTTEEVLTQISNGRSIEPGKAFANALQWLADAIRMLQDVWGLLTVIVVIIGLAIMMAGFFTHNSKWKSGGINTIIAALVSLLLVHLLPVIVLAIERMVK
ncbi:MAG: hypothetical protein QXP27_08960 [Candidatus Methanomethyliaceae archaeon]